MITQIIQDAKLASQRHAENLIFLPPVCREVVAQFDDLLHRCGEADEWLKLLSEMNRTKREQIFAAEGEIAAFRKKYRKTAKKASRLKTVNLWMDRQRLTAAQKLEEQNHKIQTLQTQIVKLKELAVKQQPETEYVPPAGPKRSNSRLPRRQKSTSPRPPVTRSKRAAPKVAATAVQDLPSRTPLKLRLRSHQRNQ